MLYLKEIKPIGSYDVVVCGGGFSGFAAAYAAAREGSNVILVDRNGSLGGVGTQALVNHLLGMRCIVDGDIKTCIGGLFAELEKRLIAIDGAVDVNTIDLDVNPHGWLPHLAIGLIFDNEKMKLTLEAMLREVGVKILYYTDIIDVVKNGSKVKGIIVHNKNGLGVITGKIIVDATGDGDICHYAGCDAFFGDENGELSAASLEMHVENVDYEELSEYMVRTNDRRFRALIPPLRESGDWKFPYDIFISVMLTKKDVFMINTIRQVGINGVDAESMTDGVLNGRIESNELLEVMRKHFPGFKNARIRQIAPMIGIRETRRIKGEYVLSVDDLIDAEEFDDSVALSFYPWDMPHPKKPSLQPFAHVQRKSDITPIPYRCLVPKGLDNVLMVGRCISVEREVLGTVRVMGPCIAMGEAAGIAAKLAIDNNTACRNVDTDILRSKITAYGGFVSRSQVR